MRTGESTVGVAVHFRPVPPLLQVWPPAHAPRPVGCYMYGLLDGGSTSDNPIASCACATDRAYPQPCFIDNVQSYRAV
jgi:hypothetical protein